MNRQLIILAIGIAFFSLAFPPADLGFLGFVALVPFIIACHEPWSRKSYLYFYLSGVVLFLVACAWLAETAFIILLGMAVAEGLALPLFAFLYRTGIHHARLPAWFSAPLAWISVEYFRSVFPLDGFPWLLLGYSSCFIDPLLQTADLCGVWGPGFLLALSSGVVAVYLLPHISGQTPAGRLPADRTPLSVISNRYAGTGLFLVLFAGALIYGTCRPSTVVIEKGPVLATIQGNIPQELKDDSYRFEEVFGRYLNATRELLSGGFKSPDLVVWPETIYGLPVSDDTAGEVWHKDENGNEYGDAYWRAREKELVVDLVIEDVVGPAHAWFLMGAGTYRLGADGLLEKRNSAILYNPEGNRCSSYSKTVLVPGGEYLPWIARLPFREEIETWVMDLAGFLPNLKPGQGPSVHTIDAGGKKYCFGVQICYENSYGDYCRRFVREGAEFMINLSNEGWFGRSSEFDHMMAMSFFRAVETRRSYYRSTNTGISCVIDPLGKVPQGGRIVVNGEDRDVAGILSCEVPLCRVRTFYMELGDFFPKVLVLFQVLVIFVFLVGSLVVTKISKQDT